MRKNKKSLYERITAAMGFVWLVSVCAVDSQHMLPVVACVVSTLWLGAYVYRLNNKGGDDIE